MTSKTPLSLLPSRHALSHYAPARSILLAALCLLPQWALAEGDAPPPAIGLSNPTFLTGQQLRNYTNSQIGSSSASYLPSLSPTTKPAQPSAPESGGEEDAAYAALQRGYYVTAYTEAKKRVDANKNDAVAMTLLGWLYSEGLGIPNKADGERLSEAERLAEAARWYKSAADLGNANAQFAYGAAALQGKGVARDPSAAKAYFEKAATAGKQEAQFNLGMMAIEYAAGFPDFPVAIKYFRAAAEGGNGEAAYSLGVLYQEGKGVEPSNAEALKYFKQGADLENIPSMVEYAIMLFKGRGVTDWNKERDEAAAARILLKAANHNNPVAQNRIARLLAAGRAVSQKNLVEAMKWHLIARSAGINDPWLDDQLATLSPEQRSAVEEAIRKYHGG